MSRELDRMRKQSAAKIEAAKGALHEREAIDRHLTQIQNEYSRVFDISKRAQQLLRTWIKSSKKKQSCQTVTSHFFSYARLSNAPANIC